MKRRHISETAGLPTGRDEYDIPSSPNQPSDNSQLPLVCRMKKGLTSTKPLTTLEESIEEQAKLAEDKPSKKRRIRKRKGDVIYEPAQSNVFASTAKSAGSIERVEDVTRGRSHSRPSMVRSANNPVTNARQTRSNHTGPFTELPRRTRRTVDRPGPPSSNNSTASDQPDIDHEPRSTREGSEVLGDTSVCDSDDLPSTERVLEANTANDKDQTQPQTSEPEVNDIGEQSAEEFIEEEVDEEGSEAKTDTSQSQDRPDETFRTKRQTDRLNALRKALKGVKYHVPPETRVVKDFVRLVSQTEKEYPEGIDGDSQEKEECIEKLNDRLEEISRRIDDITEVKAKENNQESLMVIDLYRHAIPVLANMFYTRIKHQGDVGLEQMIKMIELVDRLYEKAHRWSKRPDTSLRIVKPILQVMPPLRKMKKDLQRDVQRNVQKRRQKADRKVLEEENERVRQKAEEKERRRRAESEQLKRERHLLIERQLEQAMQRIDGRQRSSQIASLSPEQRDNERPNQQRRRTNHLDEDDDGGETFERVQMFHSPGRTGSGVPSERWAWPEITALVEGLERFEGPDRYTQILQANSGSGQALRRRNFDELVRKAKEVKADYLIQQELHPNGRRPPDWLLSV